MFNRRQGYPCVSLGLRHRPAKQLLEFRPRRESLRAADLHELFLSLNDIEHTRTRPYRPQTNGCVERLNQIIQEEFYAVAFRKKLYVSIAEIQSDLDVFMAWYNEERTNQGKYCQGRTPAQTFADGLELYQRHVYENGVVENGAE